MAMLLIRVGSTAYKVAKSDFLGILACYCSHLRTQSSLLLCRWCSISVISFHFLSDISQPTARVICFQTFFCTLLTSMRYNLFELQAHKLRNDTSSSFWFHDIPVPVFLLTLQFYNTTFLQTISFFIRFGSCFHKLSFAYYFTSVLPWTHFVDMHWILSNQKSQSPLWILYLSQVSKSFLVTAKRCNSQGLNTYCLPH